MAKNKNVLDRADLALAAESFARGFAASRKHGEVSGAALEKYGDHGSQISGIVRDHFPQSVKNELRDLCATMNMHDSIGWDMRPHGVRFSTMNKLRRALKERDGCGFYL